MSHSLGDELGGESGRTARGNSLRSHAAGAQHRLFAELPPKLENAVTRYSATRLRYCGLYLTREHTLASIRIHRGEDVIVSMSALNRGVGVVGAGIQGRIYLGIRSTRDRPTIHVIANHTG